jgi:thiol-disulfide isomerase/thioredoxin
MKKKIVAYLMLAVMLLAVTACGSAGPAQGGGSPEGTQAEAINPDQDNNDWTYDALGIKITPDEAWKKYDGSIDDWGGVFLFKDEIVCGQLMIAWTDGNSDSKSLFQIAAGAKEKEPDEAKVKDILHCENAEKIGEKDDLIYYFCWSAQDDSGLDGNAKDVYDALYADLSNIKKNISFYSPDPKAVEEYYKENPATDYNAETKEKLQDTNQITFDTKDLDGNTVSSDLFGENKVTVINVWGTFCGPCIAEMPDLDALSQEMKDQGVGIIGLVIDTVDANYTEDQGIIDLARQIVSEKGVKYQNLISNKDLSELLPVVAVPTTIFVDSEGNILGDAAVGGKGRDEYRRLIESALAEAE